MPQKPPDIPIEEQAPPDIPINVGEPPPDIPVSGGPTTFKIDLQSRDQPPENKGVLESIWDKANTPLLDLGVGKQGPMPQAQNLMRTEHPMLAKAADIGMGIMEGATSPLNLATEAATGGAALGVPFAKPIAQALSLPMGVHGAINLASPESSLTDRITGGLELAGGLVGARSIYKGIKRPGITSEVPEVPKVKPTIDFFKNPDGSYVDISNGNVHDIENGTVIVGHTTPENLATLREKGFVNTGIQNTEGKPIWKLKDAEVPKENVPLTGKDKIKYNVRQVYDLARGVMAVDLPFTTSAAFRQGLPMIGTKQWFQGWVKAAKAFGSETAYNAMMDNLYDSEYFKSQKVTSWNQKTGEFTWKEKPSYAKTWGLKLSDPRDMQARTQEMSQLAERIPIFGQYAKRSNRAFSAFVNHIKASTLNDMVEGAKAAGIDPTKNPEYGKEIADFINDATGTGHLKLHIGISKEHEFTYDLEKKAQLAADVFFSPRLMASRINMLNPSTYLTASPQVRKQYVYAMMRVAAAWTAFAGISELAGAKVNHNLSSADFGKIRIGNTRLDPAGGFQQFMVLAARMYSGGWTTTSGTNPKFEPFGKGHNPQTYWSTMERFAANKMHPVPKLLYDIWNSDQYHQTPVGDRVIQLYTPMVIGDMIEVTREHPELLPLSIPFGGLGGNVQEYQGEKNPSTYTPLLGLEDMDYYAGSNGKKNRR